jgi:hypothetical protein
MLACIILAGVKPVISILVLSAAASLSGCRPEASHALGKAPVATAEVPVVREASVIAFWLPSADTLLPKDLRLAREQFRRSNQVVADYLDDTDVTLLATVQDTVVVRLEGGSTRVVMLSGLDYPYGYVFIEPGYAEEFHTGPSSDDDIEDALDDYFGLEPPDSAPPHRIARAVSVAQRRPVQPGPRMARPGLAPVCMPSWTTSTPLTRTWRIPTDTWWGRSNVARSATVSGSNTTTSA